MKGFHFFLFELPMNKFEMRHPFSFLIKNTKIFSEINYKMHGFLIP